MQNYQNQDPQFTDGEEFVTPNQSNPLLRQLWVNVFWGVVVAGLGFLNWMPKEFMAASLAMNVIVTGASLMKKTPVTAKIVTDLNKGLVIITVLSVVIRFLFGALDFTFTWF